VAVPGRLELPTFGLGNRCSILLSYGTTSPTYSQCIYRFAGIKNAETIVTCPRSVLGQEKSSTCARMRCVVTMSIDTQ
jgi:hypothetical protein